MKKFLIFSTLFLNLAVCASEPAAKKEKSGQEGVIGDAVELGVNRVATAIDSAVKAEKEREKAIACPKRKVAGLMAGISSDASRANSIKSIQEGQRVEFEDNTIWIAGRKFQYSPRNRSFEMCTIEYEQPTEIFGIPLWSSRIEERWRQGVNNKNKTCTGLKTTFRKLDREFTPYGYVAIAGAALVTLKVLWKIAS